jgi:putative transposase
MSRGDRKGNIYIDDRDRRAWLDIAALVCGRFNLVVHAYCQMANHYHLLLETANGNLSQGMRQINGLYTQYFNRRHKLVGHVFQGRYKAILVQRESHLLELARYVVLNPLRACMVESLEDWPWSSHHIVLGTRPAPAWVNRTWLLSQFSGDERGAVQAYSAFVMDGVGKASPLKHAQHQLMLGDASFIEQHRNAVPLAQLHEVSRAHRRAVAVLTLQEYEAQYPLRAEAMANAYHSTAFTMAQIASHFGVSQRTVSREIRRAENAK